MFVLFCGFCGLEFEGEGISVVEGIFVGFFYAFFTPHGCRGGGGGGGGEGQEDEEEEGEGLFIIQRY